MAGTAKNYTSVDVPQGPADVWFDIALPGAGATATLFSDGTPDATASPSAIHLGKLKDGVKVTYKPKLVPFVSDESGTPYRITLESDSISLAGSWAQLQNSQLLLRMMPSATRTTGSGYERLTVGGMVTALPYYVVMLVWAKPETANKYVSLIIYKGINMDGLAFSVTKKAPSESTFNIEGLNVDTRAVNDQLFQINSQV